MQAATTAATSSSCSLARSETWALTKSAEKKRRRCGFQACPLGAPSPSRRSLSATVCCGHGEAAGSHGRGHLPILCSRADDYASRHRLAYFLRYFASVSSLIRRIALSRSFFSPVAAYSLRKASMTSNRINVLFFSEVASR